MDNSAQVSFEYLITVALAIGFTITVTIIAFQVISMSELTKTKIIEARDGTIRSIVGQ